MILLLFCNGQIQFYYLSKSQITNDIFTVDIIGFIFCMKKIIDIVIVTFYIYTSRL